MFYALTLLAEGEQAAPGGGLLAFAPLIIIFILFYFLLIRPAQKREQNQRAQLLANLKKNDKVLTSGGIIGVVALINDKEDEVILKVDESSNVRLRVLKSSIVKNYTSEEAAKEQAARDKPGAGKEEAIKAAKS